MRSPSISEELCKCSIYRIRRSLLIPSRKGPLPHFFFSHFTCQFYFSRLWILSPCALSLFGRVALTSRHCGSLPLRTLRLEVSWLLARAPVGALRGSIACLLSLLSSQERRPQSPGPPHLHSREPQLRAVLSRCGLLAVRPHKLPDLYHEHNDFAHLPTPWDGCGDK